MCMWLLLLIRFAAVQQSNYCTFVVISTMGIAVSSTELMMMTHVPRLTCPITILSADAEQCCTAFCHDSNALLLLYNVHQQEHHFPEKIIISLTYFLPSNVAKIAALLSVWHLLQCVQYSIFLTFEKWIRSWSRKGNVHFISWGSSSEGVTWWEANCHAAQTARN